jgi:phage terminase Nu1 subunit (DNA packaging protein)
MVKTQSLKGEVSAKELAELFGISDRSVRELHDRGITKKSGRGRYLLTESVQLYTAHLRGVAAGRGGEDGVLDLTVQRARLAKEQADSQALKNATQRNEMVPAIEVERGWTTVCRRVRNAMLAVPSRVRQTLPHLTAYDASVIDREVRDALSELGADDCDRETDLGGVGQHGPASEDEAVGMDRA